MKKVISARIFIADSARGLGLMTGRLLAEAGHKVVLHARDAAPAAAATRAALPVAAGVMEGDVATLAGMRAVAAHANALGSFGAVIHNVAIGYREPRRDITADELPALFATDVLAPYVLAALMHRLRRLIYLSSGMQHHVHAELDDMLWERRRWNGSTA